MIKLDLLEVEIKIRLDRELEEIFKANISRLSKATAEMIETDIYLDNERYDLTRKDSAFRIRKITRNASDNLEITFKGPKLSHDIKTRHEMTLKLDSESVEDIRAFFKSLGFNPIGNVNKNRKIWVIHEEDWKYTVSFDVVENLGKFIEIETIVNRDKQEIAEERIINLLTSIIGEKNECRIKLITQSYLELLLSRKRSGINESPGK
ncbi:MAG: class IV adenylate cyclase [Candidatus Hodarchaeales archaeon]